MTTLFTIIGIVAALAVGLVIGFLVAKVKSNALQARGEMLAAQLAEKDKSFREQLEERQRVYDAMLAEHDRKASAEMDQMREHNREMLDAMQKRFDETVAKMKAELETETSEMLKRRQNEFETTNSQSMSKIIEPLNKSISEMQKTVADNTLRHTEFGGKLDANIRMVMEHSDAARKSADRLADALRGSGKIQGNWGETVLTELLESQGLTEGVHFETQATLRDSAGNAIVSDKDRKLRPDVVLHLDRERDVIIDAKVSLSAYLDYMQAETDEAREAALTAHVRSVESHVNELVSKNYSSYISKGRVGVEYVIMFIPNTAALYAATARKTSLWRNAMERGVYIADEQTLYAALKIVDLTWRQIAQAENHEKVYALANEMLDRVNMFMEKFQAMGRKIEESQKYYHEAVGKLQESGQSIPQTCRKLIKLGASVTPRKGVDPQLLGIES